MSNVIYAALSRQSALKSELSSLANNIANSSTVGFRGDSQIFSEYVNATPGQPSISQTRIGGRAINNSQGDLVRTGGAFAIAIEGEGYFVVQTPQGERLTRAGAFHRSETGALATAEGHLLHGAGAGTIDIPADAGAIIIAQDGVVSSNGAVIGTIRIAIADPTSLTREGATLFRSDEEVSDVAASLRQGFVESSNVEPVLELSRLIEVQRAFEIGQQFLTSESERIERAVAVIGGNR